LQRCPDCDQAIQADDINIREGVALCPDCGKLSRLSELNDSDRSTAEVLDCPPSGCAVFSTGNAVVVSASLRSLGTAVGGIAIALFWNGIVSVFVLIAFCGLYTNLVGPLPHWFPAPGKDNVNANGGPMELGEALFLCVFLIPFVTVGAAMIGFVFLNIFGSVRVVIDEFDSYVATGVGFLRWKTRFDAHAVRAVNRGLSSWKTNDRHQPLIELVADRTIKFGSFMRDERREWLMAVLKKLFLNPDDKRAGSDLPRLTWLLPKR
jgi:hypothetical protein